MSTTTTPNSVLNRLTIIVAVQWIGSTLGLPLLPLFLEHRGGTPSITGFVVASFFVAGVLTQFLMGHLTDKFGRRRVLLFSLVLYGAGSFLFALPVPVAWLSSARICQGAAAGAIEVASLSAIAFMFPQEQRGRAISRIYAAQLFGIALGPLLGAAFTVSQLSWAYVGAGAVSWVAAVLARNLDLGSEAPHEGPLPPIQWNGRLRGALVAGAGTGLLVGVYETCWSLLMHAHHATSLQIRLSWTLFSVPWVLLSSFGGRLADHANRRIVALGGLLNGALFLAIYPHIHNNVAMLFLGSVEAIGASLSMPSISSLMSEGALSREQGRRQGLYTTANTASLALSSSVAGLLFTKNVALPFTLVAIVSGSMALSTLWWWRGVRGRVQKVS